VLRVSKGESAAPAPCSVVLRVSRGGGDVSGLFSGVLRVSKRERAAPVPFSIVLRVSRRGGDVPGLFSGVLRVTKGEGADWFAQGGPLRNRRKEYSVVEKRRVVLVWVALL
jgi:hypothetical protein